MALGGNSHRRRALARTDDDNAPTGWNSGQMWRQASGGMGSGVGGRVERIEQLARADVCPARHVLTLSRFASFFGLGLRNPLPPVKD